jgi:hypothetical protein
MSTEKNKSNDNRREYLRAVNNAGRHGLDLVLDSHGKLWAVKPIVATTGERITHRSADFQIRHGFDADTADRWRAGELKQDELSAVVSWILWVMGCAGPASSREIILERVGRS